MKFEQAPGMILAIALSSIPVTAVAQHEHDVQKSGAPKSQAQISFDTMKTLSGDWEGKVTVMPPMKDAEDLDVMHISLRVTSRGNAVVHEMQKANTPLDPSKYDHPVTMFYVADSQLNLVHYCDAGNRPHMSGTMSPDGKTLDFEFRELSGGDQYGHMYHALFTSIDADHHLEDWTYMLPGGKPIVAHFELHRVNRAATGGAD